jgi:hypothetical protein
LQTDLAPKLANMALGEAIFAKTGVKAPSDQEKQKMK